MPEVSPRPWRIHRTGSVLGIKDAKGKFVFRKVVNMITSEQYDQLLADFNHIVERVNREPDHLWMVEQEVSGLQTVQALTE